MPFTKRTSQDLPVEALHGLAVRSLFRPEEAERLSVRWIRMEPHRQVPPSKHGVAQEVVYVLEGEAEWVIGAERGVCRAGDFLNIPPGSVHAMRTRDQAITFLAVQSPPVEDDHDLYWVDEDVWPDPA